MSKSVSVYLDERDIKILDRLAKAERRSRSAMVGELIRRYATLAQGESLERHPLFRAYNSDRLDEFLKEDEKVSSNELAAYRKLLGLN